MYNLNEWLLRLKELFILLSFLRRLAEKESAASLKATHERRKRMVEH